MKNREKLFLEMCLWVFLMMGTVSWALFFVCPFWVAVLFGIVFSVLLAWAIVYDWTKKFHSYPQDEKDLTLFDKGMATGLSGFSGVAVFLWPYVDFKGIMIYGYLVLLLGSSFLLLILGVLKITKRF